MTIHIYVCGDGVGSNDSGYHDGIDKGRRIVNIAG